MVLIDAGIVIAVLDAADPHHTAVEQRLRQIATARTPLLASLVTYSEVLVGVHRGHHDEEPVRDPSPR